MKSSMRDEYAKNPRGGGGSRSTFNLNETNKTTFNANSLIPIYWDYMYPGEVRKSTTRMFIRMSNPLEFPLMDNIYVTVHWFDVSLRILWDNFRKFYGEQDNPGDSIDFTIPTLASGNADLTAGTVYTDLCDYLGLPHVASFDQTDASALPFRAYNKIFNYWYRDQQLQNSIDESTDDGPDLGATDYAVKQRGKRFDYFTNQLPAPQRGDSIKLPGEIASDAAIGTEYAIVRNPNDTYNTVGTAGARAIVDATAGSAGRVLYNNATINDLRNAVSIQLFIEKDNRAGTRFGEMILSHWGTEFQDARYAPVYLAGGRAPIQITPVLNQSNATATQDQDLGDLGAIGSGSMQGASFTYACHEPSILMGIMSVTADQTYHQGLKRQWSYRTRYDFMWPEFQGIGDQATLNKEIYYQNNASDDLVFGYAPRYEECRIGINRLSGEMRPDNALSLDVWHVAQDFVGLPVLNSAYIESAVPMGRVLQSTINDHFIADVYIQMSSTRQLSLTGIPGLSRL